MYISDLHTHTYFCDGKTSPKEMVKRAIEKGFVSYGICIHSPMNFKNDYECPVEKVPLFLAEMKRLKQHCSKDIELYCGIELDSDCVDIDLTEFDYVIGAVHQMPGHKYIDLSLEYLSDVVKTDYNGDALEMIIKYYEIAIEFLTKIQPQIIAHIDLYEKFNSLCELFDNTTEEYISIVEKFIPRLVSACPNSYFELNTGAMYRCGCKMPYPLSEIMKILKKSNAKLCLNSDGHNPDAIGFSFDYAIDYARSFGFEELYMLKGGIFVPVSI